MSTIAEPCAQYIIDEPWAKIPLSIADDDRLTRADLRVYIRLDYMGGRRGHWYGARSILAEALGIHPNTVALSVRALVERGYIAVERMGIRHDNVYRYYILARTQAPPPVDDPPVYSDTVDTTDVNSVDGTDVDSVSAVALTSSIVHRSQPQITTTERRRAPARVTPVTDIDEPFIEEMIAEYGARLGGATGVRSTIEEALNHKASDRWKNPRIGIRGWLRRDAAAAAERGNGNGRGRGATNGGNDGGAGTTGRANAYGTWAEAAARQEAARPPSMRVSDDDDL